jgi:hypothetical protein
MDITLQWTFSDANCCMNSNSPRTAITIENKSATLGETTGHCTIQSVRSRQVEPKFNYHISQLSPTRYCQRR